MPAQALLTRPVEPTENELRAVWMTVCNRPGWQASFEATMQDPINSRLVRLIAKHPPRTLRSALPLPPAPCDAHLWGPGGPPRRAPLPVRFDRKRAAAGDRDDD